MAGKKDKVKDSERYSILIDNLDRCYVCGSKDRVAKHEIFFGSANRTKSKEDGLIVPLCWCHHNGSNLGVHFNNIFDLKLKKQGEKYWIMKYTDKKDPIEYRIKQFINRFGKNYLDDEDINAIKSVNR